MNSYQRALYLFALRSDDSSSLFYHISIMDKLPSELIPNIINRLTCGQDLQNAKSAYRAFGPCANRRLFQHLTVWIQKASLDRYVDLSGICVSNAPSDFLIHLSVTVLTPGIRLMNISRSDHLRRHVRSISIGPEMLGSTNTSWSHFLGLLHMQKYDPIRYELPNPLAFNGLGQPIQDDYWTRDRLEAGWRMQNNLSHEHGTLLSTDAYEECLTVVFSNLPNLRAISIQSLSGDDYQISWGMRSYVNQIPSWPYHIQKLDAEPMTWYQLDILCRAAARANPMLEKIEFGHDAYSQDLGSGRAIFSEADLACATIAFQHVKVLKMDMPRGIRGLVDAPEMEQMNIAEFISSMPLLESLELTDNYQAEEIVLRLSETPAFPKLLTLRLTKFRCFGDDLIQFVWNHSSTLKELEITDCVVPVECLESCFETLDQGLMLEEYSISLIEDEGNLEEEERIVYLPAFAFKERGR